LNLVSLIVGDRMRTDKGNLLIKKILSDNIKFILSKALHPFRNGFILYNISNRAQKGKVNLNYWDEAYNLGDTLSPIVVQYMLDKKGLDYSAKSNLRIHLYAIGSILTAGIQDCTVWGSGIISPSLLYRVKNRKLDIRAVRGPLTHYLLEDCGYVVPPVYGDPAILMPYIYCPSGIAKKWKYGLVLHKDDDLSRVQRSIKGNMKILNIKTDNFSEFIDELCSVKLVISSSLHGIILAESYGIPAIWIKPTKDYSFKFVDWYYSTERFKFPICNSIEEALNSEPPELPGLNEMRKRLMSVFPYDLFKGQ